VFRVFCSKGTYIRVLVEDIAKRAGTIAHTVRLHRETVGDFESANMLDMSTIEALAEQGLQGLRDKLLPADVALADFPAVTLGAEDAQRFCGGQAVPAEIEAQKGLARVYEVGERFLGVGELLEEGILAPRRVFLTQEQTP
jgi:tRNA pseudouridine55 synthase